MEMLLESQFTPIRNTTSSHLRRNPVSSRHQTFILTKQEDPGMWTISPPYASNRAEMEDCIDVDQHCPPLRSSKWSSRRFNPTIRPRSETPRSTITRTALNPSFFIFVSLGPVHCTNPSWANFPTILVQVGPWTTLKERERTLTYPTHPLPPPPLPCPAHKTPWLPKLWNRHPAKEKHGISSTPEIPSHLRTDTAATARRISTTNMQRPVRPLRESGTGYHDYNAAALGIEGLLLPVMVSREH